MIDVSEASRWRGHRSLAAFLFDQYPSDEELIEIRNEDWAAVVIRSSGHPFDGVPIIHSLSNPDVVGAGDVVRIGETGIVAVRYRRGANANSLFVTSRCNNCCLMCSQPPLDEDDEEQVREVLALIPLIDPDVRDLGVTGGEPSLLKERLAPIIATCKKHLPETRLHVLTNGRMFAATEMVANLISVAHPRVTWAIPLYSDVAARHDYIVQAKGAFEESLDGIYNLAARGQAIEIRFVINAQTVGRLPQFAEFIWRNLPFVVHVAFMGLEPMGHARRNRDLLWIDPIDCVPELEAAVIHLARRGMAVSIYNLPLCVLPPDLWPFARQSISDWKNTYVQDCAGCRVRDNCCGFFSSAGTGWKSRAIKPIADIGGNNEAFLG